MLLPFRLPFKPQSPTFIDTGTPRLRTTWAKMKVLKKHLRPVHLAPWETIASVKLTANASPREDKREFRPTGGRLTLDMSFPCFITHARKRQQNTSNLTKKYSLTDNSRNSISCSSADAVFCDIVADDRLAAHFLNRRTEAREYFHKQVQIHKR